MQYWVINENNELITTCSAPCSIKWMQSVEVPDDVTYGYVLTDKWEWIKWENLVKQEEIEKFKSLKKQYIDMENDEKIKLILWIEEKPTKLLSSPLDTLKTQIIDKYNALVKTYWEEIKNELF